MKRQYDYLITAQKNEIAFRLILDKCKVPHKDLSVEEIYKKYSTGDRYGIWTILSFVEINENLFEFSSEDVATMSGGGRTDRFKLEGDKIIHAGNMSVWMS